MLYLIRTFGRGRNKTSLKVGYTDNTSSRFNTYRAHNPFFEIVTTREGEREDELKIQLYLEALGLKEIFLNEWFRDTNEVVTRFHDRINRVDKVIWNNRDSLFNSSDFKSGGNKLKKSIYESLKDTFGLDTLKSSIDNEWLKIENLKYIKENSTMKKNRFF